MSAPTLDAYLNSQPPGRAAVVNTVRSLANAAVATRSYLAQSFASALGEASAGRDGDRDPQRIMEISADETFLDAARQAGVRHYCSSELDIAVDLNGKEEIALAINPLEGSTNIHANVSIGTIFSLLPASASQPEESFLRKGADQLAAGFFIYGPQLALALTLGAGTRIFAHSPRLGTFVETRLATISDRTEEFAINASNYRHWNQAMRLYIDDCLQGSNGPREKDFDMRWTDSVVAHAFRILIRSGVFLEPADGRKGHSSGGLRLICEANPIAMLVEKAGGGATDGVRRILDTVPAALSQRTPLVFGSRQEVERVARYYLAPSVIAERSPLFGNRGLFRA